MAKRLSVIRVQLKEAIRLTTGPGPGTADLELSDPAILKFKANFVEDDNSLITYVLLVNGDILHIPEHNILAITLDII